MGLPQLHHGLLHYSLLGCCPMFAPHCCQLPLQLLLLDAVRHHQLQLQVQV
jgi:hypothetical protein